MQVDTTCIRATCTWCKRGFTIGLLQALLGVLCNVFSSMDAAQVCVCVCVCVRVYVVTNVEAKNSGIKMKQNTLKHLSLSLRPTTLYNMQIVSLIYICTTDVLAYRWRMQYADDTQACIYRNQSVWNAI